MRILNTLLTTDIKRTICHTYQMCSRLKKIEHDIYMLVQQCLAQTLRAYWLNDDQLVLPSPSLSQSCEGA